MAWKLENKRLANQSPVKRILKNEMLHWSLLHAAIFGVFYSFSPFTAIFFLGQGVMAIIYLEVINYIQHYGLRRLQFEDGSYERMNEYHSWNSTFWNQQFFTVNLGRHSDHHVNPSRAYQDLRTSNKMPHLPYSLSLSVFLAFFPSTWRKIMDPLVDYYTDRALHARENSLSQKKGHTSGVAKQKKTITEEALV